MFSALFTMGMEMLLDTKCYANPKKIKQILLTRVRNVNSLSREEFDALPARELQKMVNDPVLVKFIFEDRRYSMEEVIAVIKRIKTWGRR